jgi:ABC-2 type transport system ATP-binding protein
LIEVRDLTKRYGKARGIEGLTFSVDKGEVLGFLGPNGAGKTTTMRIITGYLAATSGTVKVDGFDVFEDAMEARRRIGYLPENPPLYREMTVGGYLRFVSELKGIPRPNRKAAIISVAEAAGVDGVLSRVIGNLSKGYRQRVGLAQALLGNPEVLILDEPTAGLDPRQIIEIRNLIRSLAERHTIILSSHILPEVSMICSRVLIINNGRLVASDTPQGLSERLEGRGRIAVRIRSPKGETESLIRRIPGVVSVFIEPDDAAADDKSILFVVETDGKTDVREDIFFAVAEQGSPIIEMRPIDMSLEDVFLKLTTEERLEDEREVASGA